LSTRFEVFIRRGRLAFVALMAATAAVGWSVSTSSGGGSDRAAAAIASQVSESVGLTPFCAAVAASLVKSELRAKVAERRPTAGAMKTLAEASVDAWLQSKCPVRALPGIAFGVADAARAAAADRALP
jgi:hypothetical protein